MNDSEPMGRAGVSARTREALASAQSRRLDRGARSLGRHLLAGEGRPRGHALFGRSSLSISRRGCVRLPGQVASALEIARIPRQTSAPSPRRALDAEVDRRRHKVIFRAPLDSFHMDPEPPFVAQLLSEESLRRTGYFDVSGGCTLAACFSRACGPARCRGSQLRWGWRRWSRRSSGTTNLWGAAWRICRSGPAPNSSPSRGSDALTASPQLL